MFLLLLRIFLWYVIVRILSLYDPLKVFYITKQGSSNHGNVNCKFPDFGLLENILAFNNLLSHSGFVLNQ